MNPDSERAFSVYINIDGHDVRVASALSESEARAMVAELEETSSTGYRVVRESTPNDSSKK